MDRDGALPTPWRSSGTWATPLRIASIGGLVRDVVAVDLDDAVASPQAGDHLGQFGLTVASDAGQANDLAAAHVEREIAQRRQALVIERRSRCSTLSTTGPGSRVSFGSALEHVPTDHQPGQLDLGSALRR